MSEAIRFSDLDMSMRINPNTGDFAVKTNQEAIKQHIRLLFTGNGILFKPESRNGIELQLFDQMNSHNRYILETEIREHLAVYEPRIELLELNIEYEENLGSVSISMTYRFAEEIDRLNFRFVVSSIR